MQQIYFEKINKAAARVSYRNRLKYWVFSSVKAKLNRCVCLCVCTCACTRLNTCCVGVFVRTFDKCTSTYRVGSSGGRLNKIRRERFLTLSFYFLDWFRLGRGENRLGINYFTPIKKTTDSFNWNHIRKLFSFLQLSFLFISSFKPGSVFNIYTEYDCYIRTS